MPPPMPRAGGAPSRLEVPDEPLEANRRLVLPLRGVVREEAPNVGRAGAHDAVAVAAQRPDQQHGLAEAHHHAEEAPTDELRRVVLQRPQRVDEVRLVLRQLAPAAAEKHHVLALLEDNPRLQHGVLFAGPDEARLERHLAAPPQVRPEAELADGARVEARRVELPRLHEHVRLHVRVHGPFGVDDHGGDDEGEGHRGVPEAGRDVAPSR
eukprot:CAMPEP_0176313266 /NCGR_PEP_ID=MMETSP0121_2-20121125/67087_1 /TAXON_ID=160619 /ORGANISM="Kryptoperidinium foliaceum, Strain CCMP 1326" /LENGTH=209 /DNA_ID=CAMNT_0017655357 /DNA_START=11 /DNA_END=637 /DNA_ORIENTATION=-